MCPRTCCFSYKIFRFLQILASTPLLHNTIEVSYINSQQPETPYITFMGELGGILLKFWRKNDCVITVLLHCSLTLTSWWKLFSTWLNCHSLFYSYFMILILWWNQTIFLESHFSNLQMVHIKWFNYIINPAVALFLAILQWKNSICSFICCNRYSIK